MLYRTAEGTLVELLKYNFKNDRLYYEKVLEISKIIPKSKNTFDNKQKK